MCTQPAQHRLRVRADIMAVHLKVIIVKIIHSKWEAFHFYQYQT